MAKSIRSRSRKDARDKRKRIATLPAVRRFAREARAFCDLVERHEQFEQLVFFRRCAVALPRLYANALELPEGKHSKAVWNRQEKIRKVVSPDCYSLITEMVKRTCWEGPAPKPWHPVAKRWLRSAHTDERRVAPVKSNPYFKTVISFGVAQELEESLAGYLGDINWSWVVWSPFHREAAIRSSLSDALGGIWQDVKGGLLLHEMSAERARQQAIWNWRFLVHTHWGRHFIHAINAIEWVLSDAFWDDD